MTKTDFDAKRSSLNREITKNQNELKKLKTFDSSYFRGKSHFEEDGTQNYLVFQPINRYFIVIANTDYISSWKSKGLSAETIKSPAATGNILTPALNYYDIKTRVNFTGSFLKQSKPSYTHSTIVNIYIVYELVASSPHRDDLTLKNSLLAAVKLTENVDIDEYDYSGYGIGFYRKSSFSFPNGGFGQNVITFGEDMR